MAIRKIVFVIALALILIGVSQLVFASWWLARVRDAVESPSLYMWGLSGILFGVILLIAVLERVVGLRLLLSLIALTAIASGGVLLSNPDLVRDFTYSVVLDRSRTMQMIAVRIAGGLRVGLGLLLFYAIYAALRAPSPRTGEAAAPGQPTSPDL